MATSMTTLAAQLRKLQTPQTALLDQRTTTSRASLLFDAKEAATLDRDIIFAIGCSGLEELCKLNQHVFGRYDRTLFSDASKDFQRAVSSPIVFDFIRILSAFIILYASTGLALR